MLGFELGQPTMHFRRRLPSLTALVALEATIRHRSVTAAARELGVTQAAVSRQIALLEEEFGRPLFHRGHRAIQPTPSCLILGNALADGFSSIADSVEAIRSDAAEVVTIGATIAFSSFWLLPRISEFRQLHPGVQIRVISQDDKIDLQSGEVDIIVRFGIPPFSDGEVIASCADRVVPICSPAYAERHSLAEFPDGNFDLIETDVPNRGWYRWNEWFTRIGRRAEQVRPTLRFNHYTETVSAARAGQGVAMGWVTLIRDFLADGSLIKIGDTEFEAEGRHNVMIPAGSQPSPVRDVAAAWLTQALHRP